MQLQLLERHPTTKKKLKENNIISNDINNVYYLYIFCLIGSGKRGKSTHVIKFMIDYFPWMTLIIFAN